VGEKIILQHRCTASMQAGKSLRLYIRGEWSGHSPHSNVEVENGNEKEQRNKF